MKFSPAFVWASDGVFHVKHFDVLVIGGGHAGGQAVPLHFGLGSSTEVSITVEWPDGSVNVHRAKADQTVVLLR